ncbi:hypothetical protein CR513_10613, partial [Mucuna pruriens]
LKTIEKEATITYIREFAIKSRVAKLYNQSVIPCSFRPQDLVLRKMVHKAESNKLTPKWEGPFRARRRVRCTNSLLGARLG